MSTYDDVLIEKALLRWQVQSWIPWPSLNDDCARRMIGAVLDAVADDLRAEGWAAAIDNAIGLLDDEGRDENPYGEERDDARDMCPNCVTPWKCNGPHEERA